MGDSIECREISRDDLPAVLRLYAALERDPADVLPVVEAEHILERMARYPDYRIHVAVAAGRVVGTFALLVMDNLAHRGAPSAIIEDVAVDPAWQGRGVGKSMLRHALRLCREKGCYKAVLSADLRREQAHAFYESLGFERHGYSFRIDPGEGVHPRPRAPGKSGAGRAR